MRQKISFIALGLVLALILHACEETAPSLQTQDSKSHLLEALKTDGKVRLSGTQVDKLLMSEFGYVEDDHQLRHSLTTKAVANYLEIDEIETQSDLSNSMAREARGAMCANVVNDSFSSTPTRVEQLTDGKILCTDQDFSLTTVLSYDYANGVSEAEVHYEVYDSDVESSDSIMVQVQEPSALTSAMITGLISETDGVVGKGIVGRELLLNADNGLAPFACDSARSGGGVALMARIGMSGFSSRSADFEISLQARCED